MKLATCLMCGCRFVQYNPREHTCERCEGAVDEHDEQKSKKLPKSTPWPLAGDSGDCDDREGCL